MPLVSAKCTACGAVLEVDDSLQAAVCTYCNTPYIVEKAINNYVTNVTNHIQAENVTVVVADDANSLFEEAKLLLGESHKEGLSALNKALVKAPSNAEMWALKAKYMINDVSGEQHVHTAIQKMVMYASADQLESLSDDVIHYLVDHTEQYALVASQAYPELARHYFALSSLSNACVIEAGTRILALFENGKIPPALYSAEIQELAERIYARRVNAWEEADPETKARFSRPITYDEHIQQIDKELDEEYANIQGAKKGGCYVATAVYGSYDCPEVWTLRRFRDAQLTRTWFGRTFVRTYYAISPTLVKWFGETAWFKLLWKRTLDHIVTKLQTMGVESLPYEDKNW